MNNSVKIPAIVIFFIGSIILLVSCNKETNDDGAKYTTIWQEKFETYTINTFPSSWIKDANASDLSTNFVTDNTASESQQSLKLFGMLGGCWASIAYKSLVATSPYIIEIDLKNGDESLSGCHPDRAEVFLKKETSWQNSIGRALIQFYRDGYIYLAGTKSDQYTTNTWYKFRINYEKISSTEVKLSFWVNNDFKGDFSQPAIEEEDFLTYFGIAVEEGNAWFDNISILK